MLRCVLLVVCCFTCWAAEAAPELPVVPAQLVDRALRYVNNRVVTLGDLVDHLQTNRPKTMPTNAEEEQQMWRDALERVTDGQLLLLFAEEKQVSLDRTMVAKAAMEDVRRSGRTPAPSEMARLIEAYERREKQNAALSFFEGRHGNVTPDEILAAYAARSDEFRRPARAHVLQFVLRAADDGDRAALHEAAGALFRKARDAEGAAGDLAKSFLDRLLAAAGDDAAKAVVLDEVVVALAALPADAAGATAALRDEAKRLTERHAALRSRESVVIELNRLREQLAGQDEAAFRALVKAHSEGPRKDDGGDLGWIEPGSYQAAFDTAVFQSPVGEVSEPFWVESAGCLVFVCERTDAAQRPFAEVCGEIETQLRRARQEAVRAQAARILRSRATIRDVVAVETLLKR